MVKSMILALIVVVCGVLLAGWPGLVISTIEKHNRAQGHANASVIRLVGAIAAIFAVVFIIKWMFAGV